MRSFITHLESAIEPGVRLDHHVLQRLHNGRPLLVRYDLEAVRKSVTRMEVTSRPASMWQWRELLPVEDEQHIVSLGESPTPLIHASRLGLHFGLSNLYIKDESRLPTGSFKARGLAMAVSRARELGVKRVAIPTAGNAGGALAAYAARAGLESYIFMPADTPDVNKYEAALFGAHVFLVDGLIDDCARIIGAGAAAMDWFDLSTLKEPYRIEGKKTMGLELAMQMDWRLPQAILYPTGGGTGLIGMWKAFAELETLGWLDDTARSRMYSCQSTGCAPIANAFASGDRHALRFENAATIASGLRVPAAVGDFLILDAVRASGGEALAADESRLLEWMNLACGLEGVSLCPESAACIGVLENLVGRGKIEADDRVVIFNTGAAQKYVEVIRRDLPRISPGESVDWEELAEA